MWRIFLIALLLAGCAPLPPSPADVQAKRFENLPDKSVIYIVRTPMDSRESSGVSLDNNVQITTHGGTYYRWEVAPGTHRIAGFAGAGGLVTLTTAPGKIYFVRHTVLRGFGAGALTTSLQEIGDQDGRAMVARSELLR